MRRERKGKEYDREMGNREGIKNVFERKVVRRQGLKGRLNMHKVGRNR